MRHSCLATRIRRAKIGLHSLRNLLTKGVGLNERERTAAAVELVDCVEELLDGGEPNVLKMPHAMAASAAFDDHEKINGFAGTGGFDGERN